MDTGSGRFEQFNAKSIKEYEKKVKELEGIYPGHGGVFYEGEIIELKGSRFEISKIISNG